MKKLIIFTVITLVGLIILGSCKAPPIEEMNKAIEAVTRADNDVDAVKYAASTLAVAREAVGRMQAEADAKRYDAAKASAKEAVTAAEKAIVDGKTGAARAREEALSFLSIVGSEITLVEGEFDTAKNTENLVLDIDSLENSLNGVKTDFGDANQSLEDENYFDAISKAQPIRPVLTDIRRTISEAAIDTTRMK